MLVIGFIEHIESMCVIQCIAFIGVMECIPDMGAIDVMDCIAYPFVAIFVPPTK